MEDKNFNKIYKIIEKASLEFELETFLIGGRSLNLILKEQRFSKDYDIGFKSTEKQVSPTTIKKFIKSAVSMLNEELGTNINGRNKDNNLYSIVSPNIWKIIFDYEGVNYMFDISFDETFNELNFSKDKNGMKVIELEYILAVKWVILNKKIDELFIEENFRHVFDLVRIIDEIKEIDFNRFNQYVKKIVIYEKTRANSKFTKIIESRVIDFLKTEIQEFYMSPIENKEILLKNNEEKVIQYLKTEYGKTIRKGKLINVINEILKNVIKF